MRATATLPAARATVGEERRVSYWQVVGDQLRKNAVAMVAWRLIQGLLFVAVAAPLLAMNVPILHVAEEGLRFPLVQTLFDRSIFENGVDVFFNLLLFCLPVWLLVRGVCRRIADEGWSAFGLPGFWFRGTALVAILFVEVWSAIHGRTAIRVVVGAIVLPGAWVAANSTLRVGLRVRIPPRVARRACAALVVLGAAFLFFRAQETSPWKVWRGPEASVAGSTVFPPVPFHPSGKAEPDAPERARKSPDAQHWLGCDVNGYDVVARLIFGIRISLTIGIVAVSIYVLIGIVLGSLAGYFGGKVDLLVMRFVEIMICFPTLFLLLTIIAVFDSRSIFLIMAAIGVVGWPGVARLVRGEFLRERNLDYVTAAVAQGVPQRRIIFRHVLPNCLGPVLVSATFGIAGAILAESTLAFLGLGDGTSVSWGDMLTKGRESQEWHLILAPGFAIFFVVTVFNLLGDGLRDALDPKLRR